MMSFCLFFFFSLPDGSLLLWGHFCKPYFLRSSSLLVSRLAMKALCWGLSGWDGLCVNPLSICSYSLRYWRVCSLMYDWQKRCHI